MEYPVLMQFRQVENWRVMVESGKVNDEVASQLSYDISEKIQNELTYPGQVKVTVIRETRAVNIAR